MSTLRSPVLDDVVPLTRAECPAATEPCGHVLCRHHLWVDDRRTCTGSPRSVQSQAWGDPRQTCSLRVAELGPQTMEIVGVVLGLSRERVRQLEVAAIEQVRERDPRVLQGLRDLLEACGEMDSDEAWAGDVDEGEAPAVESCTGRRRRTARAQSDSPAARAMRMKRARERAARGI